MNTAYLLLGGNIGEREVIIGKATELIHASCGKVIKKSSLYETSPWGFIDKNNFINQVILIETLLGVEDLMQNLLNIELLIGRVRNNAANYSSRVIDIDILFYNDEIINLPDVKVPHPLLQDRKFALAPLKEIAENLIHPVLNKTIESLYNDCKDDLMVKKM